MEGIALEIPLGSGDEELWCILALGPPGCQLPPQPQETEVGSGSFSCCGSN